MGTLTYLGKILTLVAAFTVYGEVPSDFTLNLEVVSTNDSEIYIGDLVTLKLTLGFPVQQSDATVVELITSVQPTIFAIESVDIKGITVGENLEFSENDWQNNITLHPALDNKQKGIVYNTRAVANLGMVTNNESKKESTESEVTISFNAVHVSNANLSDGENAYLSAGIEYLNGANILIGQIPMTVKDAKDLDKIPSFSMTPPSEIKLMTPLSTKLTMSLPYPAADVVVSTTLMNGEEDDLFVQEIVTTRVASAFNYSVPVPRDISITAYKNCPLPNNMELAMGTLVNSARQTDDIDTSANEIDVEFIFQVTKPTIVDSILNVAVGIMINTDEVFVTNFNLTVTAQADAPVAPKSFKLFSPTQDSVSPGFAGDVPLTIDTIPSSNMEYTISLTTRQRSGTGNAMSLIAVTPTIYGSNIPCEINHDGIDADITSSTVDGVMDTGTVRFNVTNAGFVADDAIANNLGVDVVIMMAPTAVKGEHHQLVVSVNNLQEKEADFEVGEKQLYQESVSNQLSLENTCPSGHFQSGSTASFRFKVVTERGATPGPVTLEAPIPRNLTGSMFDFASASVIWKGKNVACVQLGQIKAMLSSWDANSTEKDRAVILIPLVCNTEVVDDVIEDEFVIEIKATIKEKREIFESSESKTLQFGAGIKYSKTQIWIVAATIEVDPLTDFGAVVSVTGLKVPSEQMTGNSFENTFLQWSHDGFSFHDTPLRGLPVIQELSHWSVTLRRPLISRYVRVINTDGFCMSNISYQQSNDVPAMYGPVGKYGPLSEKLMLTLDEDLSTCMPLPFTTDPETTPFLWVELKKSIFSLSAGSSFNVSLTGEGIECNSSTGPQVTMVVYPKEAPVSPFQGNKMICKYLGHKTIDIMKMQCNYHCACSGADQCSEMSLVMINSAEAGNYTLCDISVTDI